MKRPRLDAALVRRRTATYVALVRLLEHGWWVGLLATVLDVASHACGAIDATVAWASLPWVFVLGSTVGLLVGAVPAVFEAGWRAWKRRATPPTTRPSKARWPRLGDHRARQLGVVAIVVTGVLTIALARVMLPWLVAHGWWTWCLVGVTAVLFVGVSLARRRVPVDRLRVALAGVVGLAAWGWMFHDDVRRSASVERWVISHAAADLVRRLSDGDGDGFSPVLGGGDCNDDDPRIFPGAVERPGNGIDDDCRDGDSDIPADVLAVLANGGELPPVGAQNASHTEPGRPASSSEQSSLPGAAGDKVDGVLLVTIDSLRPDHLGAYGYSRPTSPTIDRLAAEGVVFEQAYSTAPKTILALPSVMSGRTTSETRWQMGRIPATPHASVRLVGEVLAGAGIRSHMISTYYALAEDHGMFRGFDSVDATLGHEALKSGAITSDRVADKAIAYLEQHHHERWFLWVHFMDTHADFVAHPGGPQFGERQVDRYDGEIAFVDRQLGRILDHVGSTRSGSNVAVIVSADHGERKRGDGTMGAHGVLDMGSLRIPLIVRSPNVAPGRSSCLTSLKDLAPTILGQFGLGHTASDMPAVDLVNLAAGDCDPQRVIVAEINARPGSGAGELMLITTDFRYYEAPTRGVSHIIVSDPETGRERLVDANDSAVYQPAVDRLRSWQESLVRDRVRHALRRSVVDRLPSGCVPLGGRTTTGLTLACYELSAREVHEGGAPVELAVYVHVGSAQARPVVFRYRWGKAGSEHGLPVWHIPGEVLSSASWPKGRYVVDRLELSYRVSGRPAAAELEVALESESTLLPLDDALPWRSLGRVAFRPTPAP